MRPSKSSDLQLLLSPLKTPDQLHRWLRLFCNMNVPRTPVCANHCAPFEYVTRAYFEPSSDQIVHAPRGGGKTRLAAVVTLLDLLHKPGSAVRILGGSLEQSLRTWEHLLPDITRLAGDLIDGSVQSSRRVTLSNGSTCAVLTQSQRAVRGLRVQKLRCDEVELFKPEIWEAAQLVSKSTPVARGAIDALSTLHEPFGLFQSILDKSASRKTPVVRWCVLDVLEKCPLERDCSTCLLWDDCLGVAKTRCDGYVSIDDAITMKRRVSIETWNAEMLCRKPSTRGTVFPTFDVDVHVTDLIATSPDDALTLAIDFGFAAPLVCLWVLDVRGLTFVIDEYVQPQRMMDEHLKQIELRPWPWAKWVACDPAGAGRNDQTATSNVQMLRRAGYLVKHRPSRIVEGIEMVRAALKPAAGQTRLAIHPRCVELIRCMKGYHYASNISGATSELPLKDGQHDHLVDALRYYFVNRSSGKATVRCY